MYNQVNVMTIALAIVVMMIAPIYAQDTMNPYSDRYSRKEAASIYENATNSISDLVDFTNTCDQYVDLIVKEEVDRCLILFQDFNNLMEQLRQRHNDTLNKNIAIANMTEDEY